MKMKIAAISIAISLGALTSCGNDVKPADKTNDTVAKQADDHEDHDHGAGNEEKETHELNKPGAGPHKGIVVEAGEKNHMEMVINGNDVLFYPLDDVTNPLDTKGWSGKVIFQYKGGSTKTIDLMMMNGALMAMGANSGGPFNAVATLTMNGESINAQFKNE